MPRPMIGSAQRLSKLTSVAEVHELFQLPDYDALDLDDADHEAVRQPYNLAKLTGIINMQLMVHTWHICVD